MKVAVKAGEAAINCVVAVEFVRGAEVAGTSITEISLIVVVEVVVTYRRVVAAASAVFAAVLAG